MSMTIYGSPQYATIREIPDLESMSAKELYNYIADKAGWKPTEGTSFDAICLDCNQSWIQFLNDKDELVAFDIWYDDRQKHYVAQTIELNESEINRQRTHLLSIKYNKKTIRVNFDIIVDCEQNDSQETLLEKARTMMQEDGLAEYINENNATIL